MASVDIYAELPPSLRKKLQPASTAPSKATQWGQSPRERPPRDLTGLVPIPARSSVPSKLSQRPLTLINPAKESDRTAIEKQSARLERKKQKVANKRRRSGRLVKSDLGPIPAGGYATSRPLLKGQANYELLRPLHKLWLGYISELLNLDLRKDTEATATPAGDATIPASNVAGPSSMPIDVPEVNQQKIAATQTPISGSPEVISLQQMQMWQSKLVKADFHGCDVEVTKAKHPSLVGITGIVAQETEGTFRIVTPRNLVKVIPKSNVTFTFSLPLPANQSGKIRDLRFELHGSNFAFRSADRASRKFKAKGAKGLDF